MERRTIVAFVLIGLLTFGWMFLMQRSQRARQAARTPAPAEQIEQPASSAPSTAPTPAPAAPKPATPEVVEAQSDAPLRDAIAVQGAMQRALWSNRGGCLRQLRLTQYPEGIKSEESALILQSYDGRCTLGLEDLTGQSPFDARNYEVVEETPERVVFRTTLPNGLRVTKQFTPSPDTYTIGVKLQFENVGTAPVELRYRIWAAARLLPDTANNPDIQAVVIQGGRNGRARFDSKAARSVGEGWTVKNSDEMPILWAGAANRYFASLLRPVPPEGQTSFSFINTVIAEQIPQSEETVGAWGGKGRADNAAVSLVSSPSGVARMIQPGQPAITDSYLYFAGPKQQDVLAAHPDLEPLQDYGTFGFVSRALLAILKTFYRIIPNYGVAIILLTIMVKLVLFPITRKGQLNMHKMQRLQPHMRELQEKYKDDRQRQGREMMELYRKHNANPMSGCWPMLLQIPIFWGLFRMLGNTVDLRLEGFVLWINDLSQPDTLTVLPEGLPFIGGAPLNILPILMVISWVVQQMTMPKPADPQQAQTQKMMMFMPIIFGFMFYGMASGLVLYWLTSTFLGIIEQRLIKHQIKHMEAKGHFAALDVVEPPARVKSQRRK